jgi:hypothetical protein
MSSGKAAGIFADVFILLAECAEQRPETSEAIKTLAVRIWDAADGHDFTPDQMGIESTLVALDLALVTPDFTLYGPPNARQ